MTGSKEAVEEPVAEASRAEKEALEGLTEPMTRALGLREEGKDEGAKAVFMEMLKTEPRLAEPRLEHVLQRRPDGGVEGAGLASGGVRLRLGEPLARGLPGAPRGARGSGTRPSRRARPRPR